MVAEQENLDIPMIATVGIVSTVLTIASVIGVQALYNTYANRETDLKVTLAPTADADSKLAEQNAKLAKFAWTNREQGTVVIPIDRAMSLVVAEYAGSANSTSKGGQAEVTTTEPPLQETRNVSN